MSKFKRGFIIEIIFVIVFINIISISYATSITVTDENLNIALQNFTSSSSNEDNYEISMNNGIITVKSDGETYTINYDLSDNPTFSVTSPITQGMTYEQFNTEISKLFLPMIGYIAVANVQGVEVEDSLAYWTMCLFGSAFSGISNSSSSSFVIVDDGTVVENSDATVIYESEFGEHVMEYVNAVYGKKQTFSDDAEIEGLNSFTLTTEQTEITNTSCNLVSTIEVDLSADFSQLIGYSEKISDSSMNSDITTDNADYNITLRVGQKCRIETTEKITGYEMDGSGCEYNKINDNCAEITGTSEGKANGYIYIGENKKSFYITVIENSENESLETINIKIDTTANTSDADETNSNNILTDNADNLSNISTNTTIDNTIAQGVLPQTGNNMKMITAIIVFICVLAIIFKIKLRNYRNIE